MAFDAGSVTASLTLDTSKFDRDLARAKAKLAGLTKDHQIKVSAVFDNAALSKARKMFADLDNMISRDAAQRLKSSPQGSVLGSLNSLFSPHPVSGAPSAQSSAQGGLLGRMITQQGGGGPAGTSGNAGRNTSTTNAVRNILTGPQPGNTSTTDQIKQVLTGQGAQDAQTTDRIRQVLTGPAPGDVSTQDVIKRVITGAAPGNIETTDTIKEKIDPASKEQVIADSADSGAKSGDAFGRTFARNAKGQFASAADDMVKESADAGDRSGSSFAASFLGHIKNLLGGGGGGGSGSKNGLIGGTAGGIGPGILGIGAKAAGGIGLGGSLLGAIPAVAAVGGALGVAGAGAGVVALGAKTLIGTKNVKGKPVTQGPLYDQAQAAGTALKDAMAQAAAGMLVPLKAAFAQIPGMLKGITPALKALFSGAGTLIMPLLQGLTDIAKMVLPGLGQAFRAVAPLIRPLLDGFGSLVKNMMPGLIAMLHAAGPAVGAFAAVLGSLGTDLGAMFSAFAPVLKASAVIFKSLMDVLSGLFPVIGQLAAVFATALAPVFTAFAGTIKALMPFLVTIGGIIASLAKAVLTDLASAFRALATLLTGIAPSLDILAKALGQVFLTLENTGVFAEFGNALEALAGPLANLINALVKGLAPALPAIITAVGDLAAGFTAGLVVVIGGVANGLAAIVKAIPPAVLTPIVEGLVALFAAFKTYTMIKAAVTSLAAFRDGMLGIDAATMANPVALIVTALIALGAAFYIAWQKSAGFRDVIKSIGTGLIDAGIVIVEVNSKIIDSFLSMVGTVLHAAVDAFGWVPGLGDKLKAASKGFDNFKATVDNAMNGTVDTMRGWRSELDGTKAAADKALGDISADFTAQGKAATESRGALDLYSAAVAKNGVTSGQAADARAKLYADMVAAGVGAITANTDISNYTNAIAQNGAGSTQAGAARKQLITDILTAGANAVTGRSDLQNYTAAVQQNGAQSTSAQGARAQLIRDLENSGLNAQQAAGLVDGLGKSLSRLPKNVNTNVNLSGSGSGGITITASGGPASGTLPGGGSMRFTNWAKGGKITEGTGPTADDVLVYVSKDETVVSAADSKTLAPTFAAMGIPGYAAGGVPSLTSGVAGVDPFGAGREDAGGMNAVAQGIRNALAVAKAAMTAAAASIGNYKPGAGVQQWRGVTQQALGLAGANVAQLTDAVLYQMQTESGGNPTAVNKTDSNWLAGHPSVGLMQVIQGTFDAYAGRFVNTGPFAYGVSENPLANIYAAIKYAQAEYGPGLRTAYGGIGTGHGYADGGMITEPVIGFGTDSGQRYSFGERGHEMVTPGGGATIADVCARLERLIATTAAVPAGVGSHMGSAIGGAAQAASFRNRFPRGGS